MRNIYERRSRGDGISSFKSAVGSRVGDMTTDEDLIVIIVRRFELICWI